LEKDLVPLVDISDRKVLDFDDNDEAVVQAKLKIVGFLDDGFKGP